jgi:hypothetical protein
MVTLAFFFGGSLGPAHPHAASSHRKKRRHDHATKKPAPG